MRRHKTQKKLNDNSMKNTLKKRALTLIDHSSSEYLAQNTTNQQVHVGLLRLWVRINLGTHSYKKNPHVLETAYDKQQVLDDYNEYNLCMMKCKPL